MKQIIAGGRGSGKSALLVKMSADTGIPILASSLKQVEHLSKLAKKLGYDTMPCPVSWDEYCTSAGFSGSDIRKKGLYIDNVDDLVRRIFAGIDIHAVTFSLDDDSAIITKSDKWLKANPFLPRVRDLHEDLRRPMRTLEHFDRVLGGKK